MVYKGYKMHVINDNPYIRTEGSRGIHLHLRTYTPNATCNKLVPSTTNYNIDI